MTGFGDQASGWGSKRGGVFRFRPEGLQQFRRALAYGCHNAGLAIEGASKALTPVHGDPAQGGRFSTFAPGAKPIGGTLRRSQTTTTYLDGERIAGPSIDENRKPVAQRETSHDIQTVVGTNVDYAVYVHDGTSRMPARPFLAEGFLEVKDEVPELIAAGARRHMGGTSRKVAKPGRSGTTSRPRDSRGRFISTK